MANWLRRTIARGAESLDDDRHALFTGLSYGDDRYQSALVSDDFRAAGLTHLLAVSGQNVAFVLILARPLIERFDYRGRWVITLGVIGFFALVTRFEPSVLRATVMAAIAATATLLGRDASSRRVLALAVALLVLVDPLLVHSVASLPANLLAAPVAGPIMMWSLSAGVGAGLLGGPLAHAIHWPTDFGIGWIQAVAGWAASARLGELRASHLVAVVIGAGGWWLARRRMLRAAAAAGTGRGAAVAGGGLADLRPAVSHRARLRSRGVAGTPDGGGRARVQSVDRETAGGSAPGRCRGGGPGGGRPGKPSPARPDPGRCRSECGWERLSPRLATAWAVPPSSGPASGCWSAAS